MPALKAVFIFNPFTDHALRNYPEYERITYESVARRMCGITVIDELIQDKDEPYASIRREQFEPVLIRQLPPMNFTSRSLLRRRHVPVSPELLGR